MDTPSEKTLPHADAAQTECSQSSQTRGQIGVLATPSTDGFTINAGPAVYRVDRATGRIASIQHNGREWLAAPLAPCFWRVPTTCDLGWKMDSKLAVWKTAGETARAETVTCTPEADGTVRIHAALTLSAGNSRAGLSYRFAPDGTVRIDMTLTPSGDDLPLIPRIGLCTELCEGIERIRWYGRGPQECYADRESGATVGLYSCRPAGFAVTYTIPQENSNRTGIRWIRFETTDGAGLCATAVDATLATGAVPHRMADMESRRHPHEVPSSKTLTIHLDYAQMGVGGDSGWGLMPHSEYCLSPDRTWRLSLRLTPLPGVNV